MSASSGIIAGAAVQASYIRVAGTLVKVSPEQFVEIVNKFRDKGIIIVHSKVGFFTKSHVYITGVHGIIFYCKPLSTLPIIVDVEAEKVRIY